MNSKRLNPIAVLFCALLFSPLGSAVPDLSFEFTNSGQIVSPTDSVTISARITNSGDAITNAFASLINIGPIPPMVFEQYIDTGLPGVPFSLTLGMGESVEFDLVTYVPFPIGGNPGDPVSTGVYTLPIAIIELAYTEIVIVGTDVQFIESAVDMQNASDFTWSVRDDSGSVPEPGTLAMLSLGLAVVGFMRRRGLSVLISPCFEWRPVGESNPCRRRERAMS